jgi:ATP-binding cassette, subfamily B (MDR/TAP), member 1
MSTGYIRLVRGPSFIFPSFADIMFFSSQRVVVLKDQRNKHAHEGSAQLACEAAGAIRTVASLTREDDCLELYSKSLEGPLRDSNRTALWSNLLYALSQSFSFFIISLVFWYGSILVSKQEFTSKQFFTGLMVR